LVSPHRDQTQEEEAMRPGSWDNPVRPDGGKKRKSRQKARRSPVYVPITTESKMTQARFLRGR
jgi:hypothetical protein